MILSLNKRENMRKISIILVGFFLLISLQAEEKINNIDKLDALDQQSKEFFKELNSIQPINIMPKEHFYTVFGNVVKDFYNNKEDENN